MIWQVVRLWLLLSLATLLAAMLLRPAPSQADDTLHHAGLVVRDSAGRLTYAWVPFPEEEINGIALLERSGIPVVTVGFGALGAGVCSIGGDGCDLATCRRTVCQASGADAPYWQYFQQNPDDPADWQWQALGASASDVADGEVFGWSWTSHDPGLPDFTPAQIAELAGVGSVPPDQPAVRTIVPEGIPAIAVVAPPDRLTTLLAAGMLMLIGGGSLYVYRHHRPVAVR